MKSTISSLVFIFVVQIAFTQETLQIKTGTKKTYFTEIYNVLKSNKNIKQGQYQKFVKDTQLKVDGFYKLDQKDSLWTEYDYKGNIETQGYYKNDKKVGIWEFYNSDGSRLQKYDFDRRELLYYEPNDSDSLRAEILTDSGNITVYLERPVKFIGGESELYTQIAHTIRYSEAALNNGIQGTVLVTFTLNEQGIASDFKIEKSLEIGLDRESIRVLKSISNEWIPAIYNGRPVTVKMHVPIRFKLSR